MAEWRQVGPDVVDLGRITGNVDSVRDVLGATATILKSISAALELVTVLFVDGPNVLEQAVGAAVNTVEQSVLDILQNNVAFAVHVNVNWNPDWKYRRDGEDVASLVPDYYNDGVTPAVGTGIDGWLLDVAYSTSDPSDPYRPLTDSDTSVQGVMFIKGVSEGGELSALQSLFDLFTDFTDFRQALQLEENLKTATAGYEALLRMGPMAFDPIMQEVSKPLEEIAQDAAGTVIASGNAGANDPDSPLFQDIDVGGFADVQLRDVLRISNSPQYHEVVEVIDTSNIRVDPPISKDNSLGGELWSIRRGGLSQLVAALPQDLREFIPTPGAYPMWASVPAAHLLPGVENLFEGLRSLADQLRVGVSQATTAGNLAILLNEKAALLEQTVDELLDLVDIVEGVAAFFEESHIISLTSDTGGMSAFVNKAMAADSKPDFGERGIVAGMVAIATSDDPSNHFENLFSLIGLSLTDFSDDTTARTTGLSETWDEFFP